MKVTRDLLQPRRCYKCLWREPHLFHDDGTATGLKPEDVPPPPKEASNDN